MLGFPSVLVWISLVRMIEAAVVPTTGSVAVPDPTCRHLSETLLNKGHASAVDAAIVATLCSGVINGYASGIGGGAFMLIKPSRSFMPREQLFDPDGVPFEPTDTVMIDCRETAPEALRLPHEYESTVGGWNIGIPGELWCLKRAHDVYGRLPWKTLFQDVIQLAKQGFSVPLNLERRIQAEHAIIQSIPSLKNDYFPNGRALKHGDVCKRVELGETLERIAEEGLDAFYKGEMAQSWVQTAQQHGSKITLQQVQDYRPIFRRPLQGTFHDTLITTADLPSSGPVLLSMLNLVEQFSHASPHVRIEALKFATAQRTRLGDESSVDMRRLVLHLLAKSTAVNLKQRLDLNMTHDPLYYADPLYLPNKEQGTCHISILQPDQDDVFAVAITTTINSSFGSRIVDPRTGILLNNQLADFSFPHRPNSLGLPPNPANQQEPGKRPMSAMVPTLVHDPIQNRWIVIGASGGYRIFAAVYQCLLSMLQDGMSASDAVSAHRFFHPLYPNKLELEHSFQSHPTLVQDILDKQHLVQWKRVVPTLVQIAEYHMGHKTVQVGIDPRLYQIDSGQ